MQKFISEIKSTHNVSLNKFFDSENTINRNRNEKEIQNKISALEKRIQALEELVQKHFSIEKPDIAAVFEDIQSNVTTLHKTTQLACSMFWIERDSRQSIRWFVNLNI